MKSPFVWSLISFAAKPRPYRQLIVVLNFIISENCLAIFRMEAGNHKKNKTPSYMFSDTFFNLLGCFHPFSLYFTLNSSIFHPSLYYVLFLRVEPYETRKFY